MGLHTNISKKQNLRARVSSLIAATVMTTGTLVAAAPLFLNQTVLAAPNTTYTARDFTSLNLTTDRTAPSGGKTIDPNSLTLKVDQTNANTSALFNQTEGLQSTAFTGSSVKAQLTVPSDWQNKPVRAGLWAIAGKTTDATETGWPIIEFANNIGGFTGFRTYNTFTGVWTNTTAFNTTSGWDKPYTLEISYNQQLKNIEFYVNDQLVGTYVATDGTDTFDQIKGVIFNNFNSATKDTTQNYSVQWQNFATGTFATLTDKDQCKGDGYKSFSDTNGNVFKNQGQCVSYVNGREDHQNQNVVTKLLSRF